MLSEEVRATSLYCVSGQPFELVALERLNFDTWAVIPAEDTVRQPKSS